MRLFALLIAVVLVALALADNRLPMLNVDGFSWAENLCFDGLGGLFVSDAVFGRLVRISFDAQARNYTSSIHVTKGFKQFGGLAATPDGHNLYAAAIFEDKSHGIILTPTKPAMVGQQDYTVLTQKLDELCNGMQLVPGDNAIYGTSETGTLTRIDITTGEHSIISSGELLKPDGLWYDEKTNLLFIGELVTKKMRVFDVATKSLIPTYFDGVSMIGAIHLIDDLMVVGEVDRNNLGATKIVAADWTGRQVVEFAMDGSWHKTITPPEGIKFNEPTSVRLGKGPGFDKNSYYITEGGGIDRKFTNRRVLQLTPGSV